MVWTQEYLSWQSLVWAQETYSPGKQLLNQFTAKQRKLFSSLSSMIVLVSVVLKRTVDDSDWRFDNLNGSHLQSQSDIVSSVDCIYVSGIHLIGQLNCHVIGCI